MTTKNTRQAKELTIGRLARAAGVHVETIRYYERRHLLLRPVRSGRAYRRYPANLVQHIDFIKRVQSLGFRLRDIQQLVELEQGRTRDPRAVAASLLVEVQRRIRLLRTLEKALRRHAQPARRGRARTAALVITLSRSEKNSD